MVADDVRNLNYRMKKLMCFCEEKNKSFVDKISKIKLEEMNSIKKLNNEDTLFKGTALSKDSSLVDQ